MHALVLMLVLCGCSCTDDLSWSRGTSVRIETIGAAEILAASQDYQPTFRGVTELAITSWQAALGDCAFPYALDNSDASARPIRLIDPALWPHGERMGEISEDYIDIKAGRADTKILAVLTHELGHAFGLNHEPDGSGSLMAETPESTIPTTTDAARARRALECE